MPITFLILILAAVVLTAHLLMTWMEGKGWVYYRSQQGKPRGVAAQNALLHFEALVNPAAEHVIEELNRQEMDIISTGQPLRLEDPDDEPED